MLVHVLRDCDFDLFGSVQERPLLGLSKPFLMVYEGRG